MPLEQTAPVPHAGPLVAVVAPHAHRPSVLQVSPEPQTFAQEPQWVTLHEVSQPLRRLASQSRKVAAHDE